MCGMYIYTHMYIVLERFDLKTVQPLLTLCVSAEMLVTPFTLKSNGASG